MSTSASGLYEFEVEYWRSREVAFGSTGDDEELYREDQAGDVSLVDRTEGGPDEHVAFDGV